MNRYSYVFNNPLSYTDPTGYSAQGTICEQKDLNGGVEDLCTMGGSGNEIQVVNADIPTDPTTEGDGETEEEATEEANNSTATETDTASVGAFNAEGSGSSVGNEETNNYQDEQSDNEADVPVGWVKIATFEGTDKQWANFKRWADGILTTKYGRDLFDDIANSSNSLTTKHDHRQQLRSNGEVNCMGRRCITTEVNNGVGHDALLRMSFSMGDRGIANHMD